MKAYNKEFAKALITILEFVDEVKNGIGKVDDRIKLHKINLKSFDGEYACVLWNETETLGVYFGVWMEYWNDMGNPICITLECDNDYKESDIEKFESFLKNHKELFHEAKVYDGYVVAALSETTVGENRVGEVILALRELYYLLNLHQPVMVARHF